MKILLPDEWSAYQGEFIALWTDVDYAYALYEPGELIAVALQDGSYPALPYPGADWFQRLAKDLQGHTAIGFEALDTAVEQFRAPDGRAAWPDFTSPAGEGVHQLALGPVFGDITEPIHFRFFLMGERILKLQTRRGYAHRDILGLMQGKSARQAARYAARVSGDATVAHSIAFARAAEVALGAEVPERAHFLRAVMAEIERLANHCGDLAEIAKIAGSGLMESQFAMLRECLVAAADAAFGHRLMMDIVVPGGVAKDISGEGDAWLRGALNRLQGELPNLQEVFRGAMEEQVTGVGIVSEAFARAFNAGGFVGRGSGLACDARVVPSYPPYQAFPINVPVEQVGDVAARIRVRLTEINESLGLVQNLLAALPSGPLAVALPTQTGAGLGVAESFRGPVWYWLKIENGHIQAAFVADASATHWKILEQAACGLNLSDFQVLERSLSPSVAGGDL